MRYRAPIIPDTETADFIVCTECVVGIDNTEEAREQHDLYHEYYCKTEAPTTTT